MTLKEFNKNYRYKKDIDKFYLPEVWEVITPDEKGIYYGDCESYALSLKKYIPRYKNWSIYSCKLNGEGHALLFKDGYVIDNNTKREIEYREYTMLYNVTDFKKYNPILKFIKLFWGYFFKWFKR